MMLKNTSLHYTNSIFSRFGLVIFFFVFSFCLKAQVSQSLIDQARAAGVSESQIQQEMARRQASGADGGASLQNVYSSNPYTPLREPYLTIEEQREINTPSKENLKLIVFGREIFTNENLTFQPDFNIPTPKDYRLAAGDELIINVWGDSELYLEKTISPDGTINIPNLGPISLTGLTIESAEQRIRTELSRIISTLEGTENANTYVSVSLGRIRSIKVNIVGEVIAPGTYTLPSLSTLFNALYAAGGVNDIGTLRNVRVFRENKEVASLDVYNYLLNGQYDANIRLENNDMIIIGPYEELVTISGEVKRNRIFELKEGETLRQLLNMSGGFTGSAFKSEVQIKRKTGERYQIATVSQENYSTFLMHDGDSVIVDGLIPMYENRITVNGAVWRPGEYELTAEVNSVKKLIEKARGLKGDEFAGRAQIIRLNEDFTSSVIAVDIRGILNGITPDIILQPEDLLYIPALTDLREEYTIKVKGAVNDPIVFPFKYNMTIEDAIIMAGGLKESASMVNVEVARRIKDPQAIHSSNIIAQQYVFTLSDNLEIISGERLFTLEPFDEVYVRFSPEYSSQQVVSIDGEIMFAGDYSLARKNTRLSDIVNLAGGLKPEAYIKGASLKRKINEDEKRRLETLLSLGNVSGGADSIDVQNIDLVSYSVGIDLAKALAKPGSQDDLVLRNGDELYIPQLQNTVKISGAVTYSNSVTYKSNMGMGAYLSQAGGYHSIARKYPIVVYMNGKVATTKKRMIFFKKYPKIEPGCEVIVPMKSFTNRGMSPFEIFTMANSATSTAAMITSLINTFK